MQLPSRSPTSLPLEQAHGSGSVHGGTEGLKSAGGFLSSAGGGSPVVLPMATEMSAAEDVENERGWGGVLRSNNVAIPPRMAATPQAASSALNVRVPMWRVPGAGGVVNTPPRRTYPAITLPEEANRTGKSVPGEVEMRSRRESSYSTATSREPTD